MPRPSRDRAEHLVEAGRPPQLRERPALRFQSALIGASGSLPGAGKRRDAAVLLVELRARDLGQQLDRRCADGIDRDS